MNNRYEIDGEVTKIFLYSSDGEEKYTLIDTEDLELVKWIDGKISSTGGKYDYATGMLGDRRVFLHRLVTRSLNLFNKEVDHIHHNTLDNRKSQLRVVSKSENQQNRRKEIQGVFLCNTSDRWISEIGIDGKTIHLGSYKKKEDAIKARKEGEKKYHTYKQSIKNA